VNQPSTRRIGAPAPLAAHAMFTPSELWQKRICCGAIGAESGTSTRFEVGAGATAPSSECST
jgi:hypothetical protein